MSETIEARKGVSEAKHVELAKSGQTHCPLCGSTNTEDDGSSTITAHAADKHMSCRDCGAGWLNDYILAGYRYLVDADDNELARVDVGPPRPAILSADLAQTAHHALEEVIEYFAMADVPPHWVEELVRPARDGLSAAGYVWDCLTADPHTILVTLYQGTDQFDFIPPGVEIEVRDYDIARDGDPDPDTAEILTDDDGDRYVRFIHEHTPGLDDQKIDEPMEAEPADRDPAADFGAFPEGESSK